MCSSDLHDITDAICDVMLADGNVSVSSSSDLHSDVIATDRAQSPLLRNAASPSLTGTPGVMERFGEERWKSIASRQLIKRPAVADDVTGLVLFLASDDAHFVTGQTMFADGGLAFL